MSTPRPPPIYAIIIGNSSYTGLPPLSGAQDVIDFTALLAERAPGCVLESLVDAGNRYSVWRLCMCVCEFMCGERVCVSASGRLAVAHCSSAAELTMSCSRVLVDRVCVLYVRAHPRREMQEVFKRFAGAMKEGCTIVFFAGHGWVVDGKHYLLGVDTPVTASKKVLFGKSAA